MSTQTLVMSTSDAPLYENLSNELVSFGTLQKHTLVINNLLLGLRRGMTSELDSGLVPLEDEGMLRIWILTVENLLGEISAIYPDKPTGGAV